MLSCDQFYHYLILKFTQLSSNISKLISITRIADIYSEILAQELHKQRIPALPTIRWATQIRRAVNVFCLPARGLGCLLLFSHVVLRRDEDLVSVP